MSHYNVNAGVPKTLVQHLIRWVADSGEVDADTAAVLREVLEQEITPELVPTLEGAKAQATEDSVGPYALQDFTLFQVLRRGYRPSKVAFLARHAWHDAGAGDWPRGCRRRAGRRTTSGRCGTGWRSSCAASSPASSSARRCPTGPRCPRRDDVAARRLADAVGREARGVARRPRPGARALAGVLSRRGRPPSDLGRPAADGIVVTRVRSAGRLSVSAGPRSGRSTLAPLAGHPTLVDRSAGPPWCGKCRGEHPAPAPPGQHHEHDTPDHGGRHGA